MQWHRELRWNVGDLAWRVSALFMIGSFLFALGSFPPYALYVDERAVGVTFFIGSIFFTSAGYSQFLQVINDPASDPADTRQTRHFRFLAVMPRNILWWATLVQLIGTLLFNLNTGNALRVSLTTQQENRLVWAPDFFGSAAFLIASHLAWIAVCHRLWRVLRDDPEWWAALLNYIGSILFMASALASFTLPTTGEIVNISIVNLGTFGGAVCFFVGAYVLLPPRVRTAPATST